MKIESNLKSKIWFCWIFFKIFFLDGLITAGVAADQLMQSFLSHQSK